VQVIAAKNRIEDQSAARIRRCNVWPSAGENSDVAPRRQSGSLDAAIYQAMVIRAISWVNLHCERAGSCRVILKRPQSLSGEQNQNDRGRCNGVNEHVTW